MCTAVGTYACEGGGKIARKKIESTEVILVAVSIRSAASHKLPQAILSTYAASSAHTDYRQVSNLLALDELVSKHTRECFQKSLKLEFRARNFSQVAPKIAAGTTTRSIIGTNPSITTKVEGFRESA